MTETPTQNSIIQSSLAANYIKPEPISDDPKGVVIFLKKIYQKIAHRLYHARCRLINLYAGLTQFLAWFILWPILRICFRIKVKGRENLRGLKGPLIIASNHQRFYDAFLLRIAIRFRSRLLPMRFMATTKFSDPFLRMVKKTGLINLLYAATGVFTIEQGLGLNKNLKRAKDILKNKGVVAMFPEGRMNKDGEITMFKRGVSALALSSHTRVLPIGITVEKTGLRKKITIQIGKAHHLETSRTYENLAENLRNEVKGLLQAQYTQAASVTELPVI